jgi:hypothetical protein
VDNAEEKANKLNSFFANICQVDETNIPENSDAILNLNSLDNLEISEKDVIDQLASIQTNKATGPDNICALLLETLSEVLVNPIQILFEQSRNKTPFLAAGNKLMLLQFTRKENATRGTTIVPSHCYISLGNYLRKLCIITPSTMSKTSLTPISLDPPPPKSFNSVSTTSPLP